MNESIQNTIEIAVPPQTLYQYITQPWLWHEWHPNSVSASATVDTLKAGDSFDEVVELQPISPIPLKMRRYPHYKVVSAIPSVQWQVEGTMKGGWLKIRYDFEPSKSGVIFTRTLTYGATGITRIIQPLLRPRMKAMSRLAVERLKTKVESIA